VVKIWDARTGEEQIALNKGNFTSAIVFESKGRRLAGAVGNTVRIWDATSGKEALVLKGHAGGVNDLDISRNGNWLASASSDGTVKVWDARRGACLHTLKGQPTGVYHVSFSPDGKRVAATGGDRERKGAIRIWDWETEKQVLNLAHDARIGKAVFSPDGKHLACYRAEIHRTTTPGRVEVWDAASGELLFRRDAHSEEVTCIAYSPKGEFLASGSYDGTVIVRDGVTGEEVLRVAPRSPITSIAFSPRGDRLAAASENGTVQIWDMTDVTPGKARKTDMKR
jgi:WD40 repeat protein